jgi:hypothetical protein
MSMSRFNQLRHLCPRRFHISANPPSGIGLVYRDIVDFADEFDEFDGIKDCKPGIWRSVCIPTARPIGNGFNASEYILYWVTDGTIDIEQSVEDWKRYEDAAHQADDREVETKLATFDWHGDDSCFSDGGVITLISTDYATREAARKILHGDGGTAAEEDDEEEEGENYEYYMESLVMEALDGRRETRGFTIGGVSCMHKCLHSKP